MSETGNLSTVTGLDVTGSWVTFFQLAVAIKFLIALVFLMLVVRRIKYFRQISALFLTVTSVLPGISLIVVASLIEQGFTNADALREITGPFGVAVLISLYLLHRKKVRSVFG